MLRSRLRRPFRRLVLVSALLVLVALVVASAASAATGDSTPSLTDDLGSWAALVGIALPAMIAILQRDHWPDWVNAVIFGVACVVASVVYGFIRFGSDFTWAHWEATLLAVVVWGIATYKSFWRPGTNSVVNKLRSFPPPNKPS